MATLRRLLFAAFLLILPLPALAQTGAYCRAGFVAGNTASAQGSETPPASHGLNPADLDRSANACVNFFQFADGGWVASHPIPPTESSWGTFNTLLDHNQDVLHQVLETAKDSKNAAPGSNEQKIGDYYASCMN
ncbi:MAG: M13 family metallopeptidase N-terminal domain-containing protein, partial [Candidatus Acidiferrales bacterium]